MSKIEDYDEFAKELFNKLRDTVMQEVEKKGIHVGQMDEPLRAAIMLALANLVSGHMSVMITSDIAEEALPENAVISAYELEGRLSELMQKLQFQASEYLFSELDDIDELMNATKSNTSH